MPNLSDTFRTIHRLRRHARDLQTEIDRGPLQLKARQTFAAKQAKALADGKDELKKYQVTVREREADLKSAHEQLVKYKRQLNQEVADKRQYDAFQHEIADAQKRCDELEETILVTMTQVDDQTVKIPVLEAAAKKAADDVAAFEADTKTRLTRFAEELQRVLAETKAAEADIPADVKPEYTRLIASYGPDGLATSEGGYCGNCRTDLTSQRKLELQMGQFVRCSACHRALYAPEPPPAPSSPEG